MKLYGFPRKKKYPFLKHEEDPPAPAYEWVKNKLYYQVWWNYQNNIETYETIELHTGIDSLRFPGNSPMNMIDCEEHMKVAELINEIFKTPGLII